MKFDERLNDPNYKKWRRKVFLRDRGKCRMPGCTRKATQAHHIIRWADAILLRYEVQNGISLCYQCHKLIWGNEATYSKIFHDIVRRKKHDK